MLNDNSPPVWQTLGFERVDDTNYRIACTWQRMNMGSSAPMLSQQAYAALNDALKNYGPQPDTIRYWGSEQAKPWVDSIGGTVGPEQVECLDCKKLLVWALLGRRKTLWNSNWKILGNPFCRMYRDENCGLMVYRKEEWLVLLRRDVILPWTREGLAGLTQEELVAFDRLQEHII